MTAISLTYNLATRTWTNPSGTAGTDWLPSLDFGTAPTWEITATGQVPPGFADAQTWTLAVARDWLSTTLPMCRTTDGVDVSQTQGGISIIAPIDTGTERFLRVVDGLGEGMPCWLQVVGMDASGTPCCMITLPVLCRPAIDPHGPGGPLPPIPATELTRAQVKALVSSGISAEVPHMIARAIAAAQADATTPFAALSGTSGTVSPGGIYTLAMTEDFTLAASQETDYGEAVVFVAPGEYTFSVAEGITLDAEMSSGNRYRLLVSWTPYGVHVEQTAEWEVA
ncbi:MAG: hypothetical protein J5654_06225 [Victivallales bacterium]|nr:hypothetical protein [Victivallales bacterium]